MLYNNGPTKEGCLKNFTIKGNNADSLNSASFNLNRATANEYYVGNRQENYFDARERIQENLLTAMNISPEIKEWISKRLSLVDNAYQRPHEAVSKMDYVTREIKDIGILLRNWRHGGEFPNIYLSSKTALFNCNVTEDGKIELAKSVSENESVNFKNTLKNGADRSLNALMDVDKKTEDDFLRSILLEKKFRLLKACASEDVSYNKWPTNNLDYAISSILIVKDVVNIAFQYNEREEVLNSLNKILSYLNEK